MRIISIGIVVFILVLPCASLRAAEDMRPRYSIKQDEPDLGTRIKRDVLSGSVLPLDKPYAKLSKAEQSYVKSQYDNMGPNDEPPFPINGLSPIYKLIDRGQQKLLVTGIMSLLVDIDDQGGATSVTVLQSPDPEMTKFVASVLMLQKYKPALCAGTPCAMQFPFSISFVNGL